MTAREAVHQDIQRIDECRERLVDKVEDWSNLPLEPLVSVKTMTYNHEPYIQKAVDSILMQEVDFPYEIVIGEDRSTDRTREIVCNYQRRHPDRIRLRLARENLHSQGLRPGTGGSKACRGKYIAFLEGDDYWTDRHKLQKEVDWLEARSDASLVHTAVSILTDSTGQKDVGLARQRHLKNSACNENDCIAEILTNRRHVYTPTVVARASMVHDVLEKRTGLSPWPMGDTPLWLELAARGPLLYLPEDTATYRVREGSASHPPTARQALVFRMGSNDMRRHYIRRFSLPAADEVEFLSNTFGKTLAMARRANAPEALRKMFDWYTQCQSKIPVAKKSEHLMVAANTAWSLRERRVLQQASSQFLSLPPQYRPRRLRFYSIVSHNRLFWFVGRLLRLLEMAKTMSRLLVKHSVLS